MLVGRPRLVSHCWKSDWVVPRVIPYPSGSHTDLSRGLRETGRLGSYVVGEGSQLLLYEANPTAG